ncbi:hypothetical protein KIMH_03280 [Bombiscardovia apis]|uniref:Permeases of the major facilitator superfamily n=1 Tax=Bombiscardovia apis TaxID=2932182 RepID=A0ABM8BBB9_9BIFI|nr:hypothetical protein KIMH_03280 [Bombiscardovia apis]
MASIYRFVLVAFALAGTYQGWLSGSARAWIPLDFQATFLLAVVMLWAAAAALLKGTEPPAWLKGFATLYALIGALAAWTFEGSAGLLAGLRVWGIPLALMTRVLVPAMAVLDFLLFDAHRRYPWHFTLSWMAYLPLYAAFVLIRAAVWPGLGAGSRASDYPYSGIDLAALGWERFVINAAQYLVACFALGLALFLIDRIMPKRTALTV